MNFLKSISIPKSIIPLLFFAVFLNILRVIIWDKMSFIYILWNIFLAVIPFMISSVLLKFVELKKIKNVFLYSTLFIWLLFIPNAHYVITDLIHLGEVKHAPIIYDTFLLFSSALVGLYFGLYSISHIDKIIEIKFSKKISSIIMPFLFVIIGLGIYIGRFMRFNSWDFFIDHFSFLNSLSDVFSETTSYIDLIIYTILFASFIYVSYKSWRAMILDSF